MIDLIYIILALLAGIIAGVVTGLIPGVHVNLIAVLLFSIPLAFISQLSPIILVVFIVAMMLTHTFLDFIPSIFLGAPDTDTELSILPGHELLSKGRGYEAVIYTAYGSALGILIILLLTPIFIFLLPKIFVYLKSVIFLILILASIYLITIEKKSRLYALIVFILAGFLGISSSSLAIENSLLPLLTGLFGSSSLITSIIKKEKLPKQRITRFWNIKVEIKELIKTGFASMASAPLCTFLPSLGSGQAAVIGSDLIGETNRKQFLVLLGSINTIVAGLALITFYAIAETRTGAVMAIEQIIGSITTLHLYMLMTIILISGIAGFFLTVFISRFAAKKIPKLNYKYLSLSILIFLAALTTYLSGFLGLLIFIVATAIGLVAILTGIRRTHLMGALMIPSILLYLPF